MSRQRPAHLRRRPPETGGEGIVVAATGVLSILNYLYTLALVWVLPPRTYVVVGALSALLLTWGTVSGAAVPWVLAREVVLGSADNLRRRRAVAFSAVATLVQALAGGVVTWLIAVHYAAPSVLAAAFAGVVWIFAAASVCGYLQGTGRFRLYAGLRIAEVVVKLGVGLGLVLLGAGAGGAVAGFACGAAVVALVGATTLLGDAGWVRGAAWDRRLWKLTGGLFAIQGGVAALVSLDYVVGSLVLHTARNFATYQAANIIARVPLYVAGAVSLVVFPRLVAAAHGRAREVRDSLALFARVCLPVTAIALTMPSTLLSRLFPHSYGNVDAVLPIAAIGGLGLGLVNLTTTFFQASGLIGRPARLLAIGVCAALGCDVLLLHWYGVQGLAAAVALEGAALSQRLLAAIRQHFVGALQHLLRPTLGSAAVVLPLAFARRHLILWCAVAACAAAPACVALLRSARRSSGSKRPRLTYLRFAAGRAADATAARRLEQLAADADVLVVCSGCCGRHDRAPAGLRHLHIPGRGRSARALYGALAPFIVAAVSTEVIAVEHGALGWSGGILRLARRPVVALVDALPSTRHASRSLRHVPFIAAASQALAAEALARAPRALVAVLEEGAAPVRDDGIDASSGAPHDLFMALTAPLGPVPARRGAAGREPARCDTRPAVPELERSQG